MATTAKPRKAGRPSRETAEGIENQIVAIARDLFFTHGYGATSIDTIARTAGISKRTFYARFPNKAAIFQAMVGRLITAVSPSQADADRLFAGDTCEETLNNVAKVMLAASLDPQTLALQRLIIAEAPRFPELGVAINAQGARRQAIERLAGLLDREVATGALAIPDTGIAAELFLQMVVGAPQRRALGLGQGMTGEELAEWARTAVRIFLRGVAVRDA